MTVLYSQMSSIGQIPNISGMGIGMIQQSPEIIYLNTDDTLAQVTTVGYLTLSAHRFQIPYNKYQMALVYTSDQGDKWLRVVVTKVSGKPVYSLAA